MIVYLPILSLLLYIRLTLLFTKMYQQQYYDYKRYLYMLARFDYLSIFDWIPLFIMIVFVIRPFVATYIPLFFILIIIFEIIKRRKEIIKIKMTRRVIRLWTILALLLLTTVVLGVYYNIYYHVVLSIYLLYPFLILLSSFITWPYERKVQNRYLKHAKEKISRIKPMIIAITGSYGKTSTKEWLDYVLKSEYKVLSTPKSFNTLMGICKTINDGLTEDTEILILEVGVDSVNGMNKFLKLFQPNYTIITSLGPQHLKTFKTIENIAKEKLKLAKATLNGGLVFLNGDCPLLKEERSENFLFYGFNEDNDYQIAIKSIDKGISLFKVNRYVYQTQILGEHFLYNLGAIITICKYLRVNNTLLKERIKELKNAPHRLSWYQDNNFTIIDDSYNSNFDSYQCALKVLNQSKGYRILITPGLIELGKEYENYNRQIADIARTSVDFIVVVGKCRPFIQVLIEKEYRNMKVVNTFQEGMEYIKANFFQEATILIENDLPDNYLH